MGVSRHFGICQGDCWRASNFAESAVCKPRTTTCHEWNPALKVGQAEGGSPIPAIIGSQNREKGCVLAYEQELPIAKSPAYRGKIACKYAYFGDKWVHDQ